ncbi:MAG: EamA family transporter [Paracoccaceae bacterium]
MSASVFALVLMAALLHAGWNALVKGAGDKLVLAMGICVAASALAILALPFVAVPARASWPYILVSVSLQTLYYFLVAAAYGRIDMGLAYPVMRGGAPMIVAALAGFLFDEHLPPMGWAGVALISAGILSLAALARGAGGSTSGLWLAVANACVIACYTLSDGIGARASGAPVGYTLWIFALTAPPVVALTLRLRGMSSLRQAMGQWQPSLMGAVGTMLSYGIALWAMTKAPVAMVAALRETSILFGAVIAILFLGERASLPRLVSVLLIGAGAAALRLT